MGKGWVYLNSQKSKKQAKNLLENYQFFAGSWRGTGGSLILKYFRKAKLEVVLIPRIFKKPKQVVIHQTKDLPNIH